MLRAEVDIPFRITDDVIERTIPKIADYGVTVGNSPGIGADFDRDHLELRMCGVRRTSPLKTMD